MPASAASFVEFPEYRRYEATRQQANNAMVALLAGSKLAAHTLQLTEGSTQLLPSIFPGVEHIRYFNLRTDMATKLLLNTGHHLGAVTVPYALALHEDFVQSCLTLLRNHSYEIKAPGDRQDTSKNRPSAWNMHEALCLTLGVHPPSRGDCDELEHFHLLREMRNTQIHAGGVISERLRDAAIKMSPTATLRWQEVGRRNPADIVSPRSVQFTTFDIFGAFATAKALGRWVNDQLRRHLPRKVWAALCVDDYAAVSTKVARSEAWGRGLVGHAQVHFGVLALTDDELLTAATEKDLWLHGRQVTPRRAARAARTKRNPGHQRGPIDGAQR